MHLKAIYLFKTKLVFLKKIIYVKFKHALSLSFLYISSDEWPYLIWGLYEQGVYPCVQEVAGRSVHCCTSSALPVGFEICSPVKRFLKMYTKNILKILALMCHVQDF